MKKVLAALIAGAFAVTAFAADAPKKDDKGAAAKAEATKKPAAAADAKKANPEPKK